MRSSEKKIKRARQIEIASAHIDKSTQKYIVTEIIHSKTNQSQYAIQKDLLVGNEQTN